MKSGDMDCANTSSSAMESLRERTQSFYADLENRTREAVADIQAASGWIQNHPCEETGQEESTSDCPDRNMELVNGKCECQFPYLPHRSDKNKCVSMDVLTGDASESQSCEELSRNLDNFLSGILSQYGKDRVIFDLQHDLCLDLVNRPGNHCENVALTSSMREMKNIVSNMNDSYDRLNNREDLLLSETTTGCNEVLDDFYIASGDAYNGIETVNQQWNNLFSLWEQHQCKDEELQDAAAGLVNDPTRNPPGELLGGSGVNTAGGGVPGGNPIPGGPGGSPLSNEFDECFVSKGYAGATDFNERYAEALEFYAIYETWIRSDRQDIAACRAARMKGEQMIEMLNDFIDCLEQAGVHLGQVQQQLGIDGSIAITDQVSALLLTLNC